jgi:penicillin-binding protein 1A
MSDARPPGPPAPEPAPDAPAAARESGFFAHLRRWYRRGASWLGSLWLRARDLDLPLGGRRLAWSLVIGAGVVWLFLGLAWGTCGFRSCPDPARLVAYQPGAAPVLLDGDGRPFATLSPAQHRLVPLDSLPEYVPRAFIAVEDRRFYHHHGVDWRRVVGAAIADLRAGGAEEGASTITMQLARNLFPDRIPGSARTLTRKLLEARVALAIEDRFSKREILELYLNNIYFGDGDYGIDAAARDYFGRPATRLTLAQAAALAALPRAPSYYDPRTHPSRARARRNLVLSLMAHQGVLDSVAAGRAETTRLAVAAEPPTGGRERQLGGYFVEAVRDVLEAHFGEDLYGSGLRVYTTLDSTAQRVAETALDGQLRTIERGGYGRFRGPRYSVHAVADSSGSDYLQGAVVVMNAHTGDVLALVGGRDFRQSRYDRALNARRQVGSAFKPFVYAAALQRGFAASQPIADEPYQVRLDRHRAWSPVNYDGDYQGLISLRDAIVLSRNVPTVRLAQAVGMRPIIDLARRAGISDEIPTSPSAALGTASLTPLEMAGAYTTFATLGVRAEPRLISRVTDANGHVLWQPPVVTRPALDPAVAFVLTDMLRDAVDRGTGAAVRDVGFTGPAAGKTGTTQDARDAWFVGYTPDLVASVWIGFDQPREIMPHATGGRLAAPVWGRVMSKIYAQRSMPWPWTPPDGVVFADVDPSTGRTLQGGCTPNDEAPRREIFLQGHVPDPACPRTGGWFLDLLRTFFGHRPQAAAAVGDDDTPITDVGRILGARVLPGTLFPDSTSLSASGTTGHGIALAPGR